MQVTNPARSTNSVRHPTEMSESNIIDFDLSEERGIAKAGAWLDHCREGLPITMGKSFLVTNVGLQVAEGHQLQRGDIDEGISNVAKAAENLNLLKATIMWIFGDLCLMAADFGNQDEVVSQAMKITGQSKHLVQQAIRLCKFFHPERRVPEFSYSHHVEIMNMAGRFPDSAVMWKVVETARAGQTTITMTPEGAEISRGEPISCEALRRALREASGGEEPPQSPLEDTTICTKCRRPL